MLPTLLRRLRTLLGLALLLAAGYPALATHLLGGEMTYRYLDANGPAAAPLRYEITITIYQNCPYGQGTGIALPNTEAVVGIYDQATGAKLNLTSVNYNNINTGSLNITNYTIVPPLNSGLCLGPKLPGGCTTQSPTQPFALQKFTAVVNLPVNLAGYYAVFSRNARNDGITNLQNSGGASLELYATLTPPLRPNRSPVFSDTAVAIICQGDTTVLLNNAIDPDGDRLVYSFGTPYGGGLPTGNFTPPPPSVAYAAGFSATAPLGTTGGAFATINAATGVAKYRASNTSANGKYVVAVDVSEYRTITNGDGTTSSLFIGTTRRDLQLVVATCPPTLSPALSAPAVQPRSYTVEAGATLTFPITGTQPGGNPLVMTVNSALLDGAGGIVSTFNGNPGTVSGSGLTGTATASGTGTVTGTFSYTPGCDAARATPYDVAVTVQDRACGGKTVSDVFRITVVRPTGPTSITGDDVICGVPATRSYTANGGTAPGVTWTVTGGTIVGSATANPVTVNWTTATGGTLTVAGISQYGCRTTETASKSVSVVPGPTLTVTGNLTTCSGTATTINVSGSGSTYTVTGGPFTGTGSTFVLAPTATTTYTVTSTTTVNGCNSSAQVTVTVTPTPAANVGATPRNTCSGVPITLGAAPVTGNTYLWSPATGLSNATVANPTLTLTNTTAVATTQTYTLTETAGNCSTTNSVVVTVNPAVVANAGSAVTICSGIPGQIGVAPVAGFTYLWSPATGLSDPTIANPTVTLPNGTSGAITQTYTLTTTNTATGCSGTATLVVTVNETVLAPANPPTGGPIVTICSGGTAQLGSPPSSSVAGVTYQWSPATGLSDPTIANPTITLTNTTNAPTTQQYGLTTTTPAGCQARTQVILVVNPAVTANPGNALTVCSGASATLGDAPVAGFTYQWSPATGLSSATVANPTVTLTNTTSAATTQTYTLTTTNTATTCVGTATVVVTVNPAAIANAGPAQAVCDNSTITLGTAALPGYTYQWSPATGLSSATVAQPVLTGVNTTNAPLTQTYTLTATTAQSCSATSTVVVTINPRPATVTITGATSVCPTITGIAYNVVTPTAPTYTWTVTGGTIASGQGTAAITVNWGPAGTGLVSVVATNAQGCNSPAATRSVTINQVLQTVTPSGPTTVCQADGPFTYTTPAVNGSSYAWQLTGTAVGTLVNTGNSTSITFTQPGTALLVVTETSNPSGGICRGTSNALTITVNPSPATNLAIAGPARFCLNSGAQTYTLAGAAGSTYAFTLGGSPLANVGGVATVPASTAVGTYTLTARETNSFGCAGPLYTRTFTVDPLPGAITISGPRFVCPATRTLTYSVPNATASSTYQWTVTNGTIASGQGTPSITVTFAAGLTANATVSVTETSQFNCGGAAVSATVVPDNSQAPQLTLASVVPTDNSRVTLTFSVASTTNTPNQVQVQRRRAGDPTYATVGTVAASATTYTDASSGLDATQNAYEYRLSLTNGCGDVLTTPVSHTTVKLAAATVPGAPGTPRDQGGTNLSWTAYQGFTVANYQVYQQNDNGGYVLLTTVSGSTLAYSVPNRGQGFNQCYRVVAVAADSRLSNANTICVEFTNGLAFYNIITPNSDGKNDKLEILNVQLYPGNTMEIYNRWGRQVFKTSNYNNDTNYWGTDPGVAPGVYYFLFKQANGSATKGWVEVVK